MTCKDCRFFFADERDATSQGNCHRYPPIPTDQSDYWPVVKPTDWCGEFQERPKAEGGAA